MQDNKKWTMDKNRSKEKNQNIQVFVRLRPLNQREHDIRSLGVVEVCSSREILVRQSNTPSITKKFTFDRAFGPSSKQVDVYREVVSPLIEEVLAGYNCTVFAYGQTGTGKTHTMVGESSDHTGSKQNDPMAGIIPRSLGQLFDELRLSNSEFTVRVSYLELYNEELFDLLAPGSGDSKLKMYEASKGSSEVKGLEEIRVRSKDEVYQILAQGQERRRIASTLMNAQSSRSHTVFTIVVKMNIKENSAEGEELVKTGKLNLVDLAGSENISKAGSDNPGKGDRKRECVVINQSLLTLGRVITALVERQPHIPYRESKLTRLLQESLGGRTKTSIIATISPGHKDLEETLSTLEYAHRARNIQNKPEVNQKVLKTTVLTEYVDENDRLRRDLMASWEKNGVYLSLTTHTETQLQLANQKKEIQEQILQIKMMKEETERLEADLKEKMEALKKTEDTLEGVRESLGLTQEELDSTKNSLTKVSHLYEEQRHVVAVQSDTERRLGQQALETRHAAELASGDAHCLHASVNKRRKLEEDNMATTRAYSATAADRRTRLKENVDSAAEKLANDLMAISSAMEQYLNESMKRQDDSKQEIDTLVNQMASAVSEVLSTIQTADRNLSDQSSHQRQHIAAMMRSHGAAAAERLVGWARRLTECLDDARQRDERAVGDVRSVAEQWRALATSRLQELERAHAAWHAEWRAHGERAAAAARGEEARRRERGASLAQAMAAERQEMQEAKERLQRELNSIMTKNEMFYTNMIQLSDLENDRITQDFKAQAALREEALQMADGYRESVRDKMAALSSDLVEMSGDVVSRAAEAHGKMCGEIEEAKRAVEVEMTSAAEDSKKECEVAAVAAEATLTESLQNSRDALQHTLSQVQNYTQDCTAGLTSIQSSTSNAFESVSESYRLRGAEVARAGDGLRGLRLVVGEQVAELDALQEEYLGRGYKEYSPTGKTPVRREYSFPRTFAATSPHERIIARFRSQRLHTDEETIELLDDTMADCTQTTAADSTTESVFVSPPPPPPPATPRSKHIVKSTSESDIYNKKGKENLSGSSSLQKLSKLRQPSSNKKVLTPQNRS